MTDTATTPTARAKDCRNDATRHDLATVHVDAQFLTDGRALKVYVSGPMTGHPQMNYPAFADAAARLRDIGYEVVSPHEIDDGGEQRSWEWYMRRHLPSVCAVDAVVTLDGWENSRGARLEVDVAKQIGLAVWPLDEVVA